MFLSALMKIPFLSKTWMNVILVFGKYYYASSKQVLSNTYDKLLNLGMLH